jgi:hypothetical protein
MNFLLRFAPPLIVAFLVGSVLVCWWAGLILICSCLMVAKGGR